MTTLGGDDLTVRAELDNNVSPELREIKDDLKGVGSQAETTGRQASRSARGFDVLHRAGKLAATGVKLAFGAALGAGYAAVRLLSASFREATEAQKVGATTTAVIKATGGAAGVTAKQIGKLSTAISLKAGIDDEAIQTGANLLLTFKQIRNEAGKGNQIFNRATQAATDLSIQFGSIDSASKMLGKALNDPVKGITALSRAGVTFTQGQQDTIKSLVDQGKLLEAQKVILGEVEHQVGGVAAAQATWRDKALVYIGNIEEKLGTALLPVLDDVARWFVRVGGPALDGYVRTFRREGVPAIRDFVDEAKPVVRKWLPRLAELVGDVGSDLKTGAGYAGDLVDAFTKLPAWARKAIIGGGITAAAFGKLGINPLTVGGGSRAGGLGGGIKAIGGAVPVYVTNSGASSAGAGGGIVDTGEGKTRAKSPSKVMRASNSIAGTAAIAFGPQIASQLAQDVVWPWQDGPFSEKAQGNPIDRFVQKMAGIKPPPLFDMLNDQMKQARLTGLLLGKDIDNLGRKKLKGDTMDIYMRNLDAADARTTGLGKHLDKVAGTKVAPPFTTPGLPQSQSKTDGYQQTLNAVGKPVTTHISADTSQAQTAVSRLADQIHTALNALLSFGGTPAPAPTTTSHRNRHPDTPATPAPASRSAGRGGVHVHPGGITVHAEGASSTVDVQRAVVDALEQYERDQYERGGV